MQPEPIVILFVANMPLQINEIASLMNGCSCTQKESYPLASASRACARVGVVSVVLSGVLSVVLPRIVFPLAGYAFPLVLASEPHTAE